MLHHVDEAAVDVADDVGVGDPGRSKNSSALSDSTCPTLSSSHPGKNPSTPASTVKSVMPLSSSPEMTRLTECPFVLKVFGPFRTQEPRRFNRLYDLSASPIGDPGMRESSTGMA